MDSGRKRSASSSNNSGPNRSVTDYDTEEQLHKAMLAVEEGCSADLSAMLAEIQEGQPVQKVGSIKEYFHVRMNRSVNELYSIQCFILHE